MDLGHHAIRLVNEQWPSPYLSTYEVGLLTTRTA
jgi:hypothetical protein